MLTYTGMPTPHAIALRQGGPDANDQTAETVVSTGAGFPCRHCLKLIPAGSEALVLAYRPFDTLHPYTETGPVFLCKADCPAPLDAKDLPEVLSVSPTYLVKGYGHDGRIMYGTGSIVGQADVPARAHAILDRADIAFVDVRSASNNCWLARIRSDGTA